jgi:three-Cys-motif partner protein
MAAKRTSKGSAHRFGGDWTTQKLDVLGNYLRSYTTALKGKPSPQNPFRKAFIDAFAGTGYRAPRIESRDQQGQEQLFPDLAAPESQALLDGSARIALSVEPAFDKYIFVEQSAARCAQLEELKAEFANLADCIDIRCGDANEEIQKLADKDWSTHRAVLFLDPYGMQVEWKTIQAVAETEAIDLWLLFPLGIGVNRLLTRSGKMPESWRHRLNLLLGTVDWYEEFYQVEPSPTLFGTDEDRVVKASMATIGKYFVERLEGVFAGVAREPGILRNSSNNPLYLLCFAVGNPRGKDIALRIAGHLFKDLR